MPISPRTALMQLKNVSVTYKNGGLATRGLRDVTLQVYNGELTTITGSSGSGKTTLLRVIGGLRRVDVGRVRMSTRIDLYAQSDRSLSRYRNRTIGFIFQDYRLLSHYNVAENVMLPLKIGGFSNRHQSVLANQALDIVGLRAYKRRRVDRLSGGQSQRVCIARALAMRPRLLLADEPTGNLDSVRSAEIMDLFQRLKTQQGVSIVMVTHDRELASQADHLITIADGRVRQDSYAPQ